MYRKLSAPISVQMEITGNCNNSCIYCYNHWREHEKLASTKLSSKNLNIICDQLISTQVFKVTLTGGRTTFILETDFAYN
jgi:MoaA/NifB/PqqE/SkfB family radical SAM enzyme